MSYAKSRYQQHSGSYLSGREIEVLAFEHVNNRLRNASTPLARREALSSALKLWAVLLNSLDRADCNLDEILRKDLFTVGTWCMRFANQALNRVVSLTALIDIQQDIIDGLKTPAKIATPPMMHGYAQTTHAAAEPLALIG